MLARMLLHVIDASRPVDHTVNRTHKNGRRCVVNHLLLRVGHFNHRHIAERAGVVRLPSRRGIKRCAIEHHFPALALLFAGNHLRVELAQERIAIVEPLRRLSDHSSLVTHHRLLSAFCHASVYLYPQPVLNSTTRSCGLIQRSSVSFRAATTVAAPSGAAKIPSVDASSFPAASISSSLAGTARPCVALTPASTRKSPSAFGTRNPDAIVAALCQGGALDSPRTYASTIGAQPVACTTTIRGRSRPIHPIASISSNALHIPINPTPPPVG